MNVLFISIDSLNRHFLDVYGNTTEFAGMAPNLERFSRRATVFDAHYAGSMPCMPARREYFAGIQEFLWRPWGPLEPFDTPLARAARRSGTTSQLITDHYHYFQHGSHSYFADYNGFEFIRGHEFDAWRTAPLHPDAVLLEQIAAQDPQSGRAAYARNVADFRVEEDFFAAKVFTAAARWLEANSARSNWLLVVDSFDVHEPFHCPEPYASRYTDEDPRDPSLLLWPHYGRIDAGASRLSARQLAFVRAQYAGKLAMVDRWFGTVLETLDRLHLWEMTLVIVTTDHGHYLGDHGWVGKPPAPLYDVLVHTPLFIWDPLHPGLGRRIGALTSAVDLYATMLDGLAAAPPERTHSRSLLPLVRGEASTHREWALYGYWGSTVNVTDGRFTYLHPCPAGEPVSCYSTMMINPHDWFAPPAVQGAAEAGRFLPYTTSPVWRYPAVGYGRHSEPLLFDTRTDPSQQDNRAGRGDPEERRMRELLQHAMRAIEAPAEQFSRLRLEAGGSS